MLGSTGQYMRSIIIAASFVLAACTGSAPPPVAVTPPRPAPPPTPSLSTLKLSADTCVRVHDWGCAATNLAAYLKLRPMDGEMQARLAIVLNWANRDDEAVPQFEKAMDIGEGSYELFAEYADSLGKVGRTDDAITWSYQALSLDSHRADIRRRLARLLVIKGRHYEALALLDEFDSALREHGQSPVFSADRMAIEASAALGGARANEKSGDTLSVARIGREFHAPVRIGDSPMTAFVIDTGATSLSMSNSLLDTSNAKYAVARKHTRVSLADGQTVDAMMVVIDRVQVGSFELRSVSAIVCPTCLPLLGENVLSQFDLSTSHPAGLEMLSLRRRQ
jgi:clan AA aspartic protease (TIGR02281 family)